MNVENLLGKVTKHLSVSRAFGSAYEKNGSLVIPVALVAGGGGGGEGESDLPANEAFEDPSEGGAARYATESSSRSGSGFGGVVVPVGVYVVKDDRVRWVPAVNANLVIVVAFLALRVLARNSRSRRRA